MKPYKKEGVLDNHLKKKQKGSGFFFYLFLIFTLKYVFTAQIKISKSLPNNYRGAVIFYVWLGYMKADMFYKKIIIMIV